MAMNSFLGFSFMFILFTSVHGFSRNYPFSNFNQSFVPIFGDDHISSIDDQGKSVQLSLDQTTGCGFTSRNSYYHAYYSASIKLPSNYSAGVVVTFYTSNSKYYVNNHDELDFEFLGNIRSQDWVIQTNVYGNGSMNRGREERFSLGFDPTQDFHTYSILWVSNSIIFYIDDIPIRETRRVDAMGGDFPSKPMSLYATIWDGSAWATGGGKYKIDYKYAPYIAKYKDFVLHGCSANPTQLPPKCDDSSSDMNATFDGLTNRERLVMKSFRLKHLTYSYCRDPARYPTPLPECVFDRQVARKRN
ncbi:probable xyloglucan endotransglucosylase/hydrolase protein 27 [Mercurialis annua]|uniref:probable xyloglucan endotransglucosylase/hydrolase protein 27 n=1 Tax=Mercurialis annua TaxID=3986 RepID=UPI0021601F54|nr:probable xyloglucan endotransglucosylase/hydrolase protein 27 [Mercurialis annua]